MDESWLHSWVFSFLILLLIVGLLTGFGALLYAVLCWTWGEGDKNELCEAPGKSHEEGNAKKPMIRKAA
jgi:hypothetical protein